MTLYRISKWNEVFERSDARKLKTLTWVSMPTDLSSTGFQLLLDDFEDEAPGLYGAWCALVSVAANCHVRGILANSKGNPLKVSHISRRTGFPAQIFEKLIEWASSKEVGWLEVVEQPSETENSESDTEKTNNPCDLREPSGDDTENFTTTRHNQTLPNQTLPDDCAQPASTENLRKDFEPPTVEQVQAYIDERRQLNPHSMKDRDLTGEKFVDHYEAQGWVGGNGIPIRDWKAKVRTWGKGRPPDGKRSRGDDEQDNRREL